MRRFPLIASLLLPLLLLLAACGDDGGEPLQADAEDAEDAGVDTTAIVGEAEGELVPFKFQGLEAVFSKDPELAIRKGLACFAQDGAEFRFRGGSLLGRAFPTCTPEFAAALGELLKVGGDKEAEFALALLDNYLGSTSIDGVLKELASRFSHDDRIMGGVRTLINSPGAWLTLR